MVSNATIALCKNLYIATLDDGRRIERADWHSLAEALFCAGVRSRNVSFEWHAGQRMITAGQKTALCAEIRRLGRDCGISEAAA